MKKIEKKHIRRIAIDIAGFGLIIISPFVSLLPGPGGLPVFIAGLGILSLNYDWAKRILENFEQRYKDFVDKHLVKNKKVSRLIDLLCLIIIATGIFILLNAQALIFRSLSNSFISFGTIVIISNQKRLDKFMKKVKRKRKHK